ncbi:hypothetical protein LXA43DRAFT_417466 [Ganoderma leucocontextum]|nr:hypothetical protein LXA43DRAFT_417466 [Ganoderma leucocontextum]
MTPGKRMTTSRPQCLLTPLASCRRGPRTRRMRSHGCRGALASPRRSRRTLGGWVPTTSTSRQRSSTPSGRHRRSARGSRRASTSSTTCWSSWIMRNGSCWRRSRGADDMHVKWRLFFFTKFFESIPASKYPKYEAYQQRVLMFVPFLTPVWGLYLELFGRKEEVDKLAFG